MNAIRTNSALRIAAVTVAFFAWLVLSNHCALAELLAAKTAPVPAEKRGCCNHQPAPAKDKKPHPPMQQECCKSLIVPAHDEVKLPVAALLEIVSLPVAWLDAPRFALTEEDGEAPATGPPPDVPGFIEFVLHRSLRSHAPPFAA